MGVSAVTCVVAEAPAVAQLRNFDVPAQEAGRGVAALARQADAQILISGRDARGKRTQAVKGSMTIEQALDRLLRGSGLVARRTAASAWSVVPDQSGTGISQAPPATVLAGVQNEDDDAGRVIVVTGTSLRGVQPTGSPLLQIDRRQIAESGLSTTQDVLRSLPQNFGGGASEGTTFSVRDGSEQNVAGGAGVNLRGLGNDSTLVLINGQRVAPGGSNGGFVDVSMVPVSAIARIDVLTDSASAIYGSDAVGGVINIILDDRYSGFETGLRAGVTTQGGGQFMQASQSAGTAWRGGRGSIHYEYRWQDRLDVGQRAFSAAAVGPTDLLSSQERHSLFATVSQDVGGATRLFAQALLSTRDADRNLNNPRLRRQFIYRNSVVQVGGSAGFTTAIGNGLDIDGNAAFSRVSTEGDRFQRGASRDFFNHVVSQIGSANLKLGGRLFELPGGEARGAVGVEYRRESFFDRARERTIGIVAPHLRRNIAAGFGELNLPLVSADSDITLINELRLSGAVRYEHYSDAGTAFSPRLGVDWKPVGGVRLRGSIGRSFRAPLLTELDTSTKQAILLFLPNPASPTGETLTLVPATAPAPDLRPERATIWSLGADVEPRFARGLRLSATYFSIDFRDRIAVVSGFGRAFLDPAYAPIITLNPSAGMIAEATSNLGFPLENLTEFEPEDAEAIFDQRTLNIARTRSKGLDISIAYAGTIGDVRAALSGNATFLFKRDDQISPASQALDSAGTVFNPADFRLRAGLTLGHKRTSLSLFANHVGGYVDNQRPVTQGIASWTTFDATVSHEIPRDAHILGGLTVSLSIQNLFDSDPPFVVDLGNSAQSLGYDPTNANPLGRMISVSLRKSW
nr:TonB-dependent receptor [Sphingomonas colocasiae]